MFPNINNKHLTCRQRKQRALPLEILVLSSFPSVSTLHIHDQDVLSHAFRLLISPFPLIFAHPYPLSGLPPLLLGHDAKLGAKEVVEQRGFPRRLRPEDGDEVVVEARRYNFLDVEIC